MKPSIFLLLLGAAVSLSAQSPAAIIVGQSFSLHSRTLQEDRTIMVYLPQGYGSSSERYPVLYVLDAETHGLATSSSAGFLSLLGEMPKVIVVGITNTDRARDMTPKPATPDKDFPGGGGSAAFLNFLTAEVQPWIQQHYRTSAFDILAGTSLSGLLVIEALLTHTDAFAAYFAASPSLWWDHGAVVERARQRLSVPVIHNRFVFVSLCEGDSPELRASVEAMLADMAKRPSDSLHYRYNYLPEESHNSSPLKSFYAGLRWLYKGWPLENATTLDQLTAHYADLSSHYGYQIAIPEAQINRLGYTLLFSNRKKEAIPVFLRNTRTYPGSANAWDSMGDAYKLNEQLDSARICYEQGCAIATRTHDPNAAGMCANAAAVKQLIGHPTK